MIASILASMILFAEQHPDAFDMDNLKEQGTYSYMCSPEYDGEDANVLKQLCSQYEIQKQTAQK